MSSTGWWAGQQITDGIDQGLRNVVAHEKAKTDLVITNAIIKRAETAEERQIEMQYVNAANLAEKYALRAALERHEPNHPLLTNAHLRERLHKLAEQAFTFAERKSWDEVIKVGQNFKS